MLIVAPATHCLMCRERAEAGKAVNLDQYKGQEQEGKDKDGSQLESGRMMVRTGMLQA